jgi:hypothetical protein
MALDVCSTVVFAALELLLRLLSDPTVRNNAHHLELYVQQYKRLAQ